MERWKILHRESDYTVIDNGIFRDPDLSLAERGFLCTIMSLPNNWNFSTRGMCELLPEGICAIQATINRLIKHGYCKKERIYDTKTRRIVGYEYTFFEVKNGLRCTSAPQIDFPCMEIPCMEIPAVEIPAVENQHQLNTKEDKVLNKSSIKESHNNIPQFSFFKSLKAIGVSDEVATAWMQVRKTKRATNTKIAFDRIKAEIDKSGRTADECIRTAVEKSWCGFQADWMPTPRRRHETMEETMIRLGMK